MISVAQKSFDFRVQISRQIMDPVPIRTEDLIASFDGSSRASLVTICMDSR